jgi:tRNA 2-selenouridine synthase
LELFGHDVAKLDGGYKSFRRWVLEQLEKNYPFVVIGGRTGAAKTESLHALQRLGEPVVDLEGLANHKGSSFGGIGINGSTTQEQFENDIAIQLHRLNQPSRIWLEDESQRIGTANLPRRMWEQMRGTTVYYLDVPFEQRLQHLVDTYGKQPVNDLVEATVRIRKKLGGLQMQTVIEHLDKKNIADAFRILLQYYDKAYDEATAKRDPNTIVKIQTDTTDPTTNATLLLNHLNT